MSRYTYRENNTPKLVLTSLACSALALFAAGVARELSVIKKLTQDADKTEDNQKQ